MPARRNSSQSWLHTAYRRTKSVLNRTEENILQMSHIYTIMNQIVFFTLCDRAIGSNQKINSVYSLMLYNVIAYCFNYVHELIRKEDWDFSIPVSAHSRVRHLAMTATGLVLEWTKAVTFLITVVFLVLSFSAKEGLDHYQPTAFYTIFTALHYLATEKTFFNLFPKLLARFKMFDNLEEMWAPVILKTYTMAISAAFAMYQLVQRNYRLAIFGLYINVVLCWRDADKNCFRELKRELFLMNSFKDATLRQLAAYDDVCSVCLSTMSSAKITACSHIFHTECLRQCVKTSGECPLCKHPLVPVNWQSR